MKTRVLYQSRTGNTEKLAKAIFAAIPDKDKDIASLDQGADSGQGDLYFVGFWTDRGSAGVEVLDFLGSLQGKKVALFGTCGMGESPEYFKKIEDNVRVFLENDNEYLGGYMCQGKMPMAVREKYAAMRNPQNEKQVEAMIRNFDTALLHPDEEDLERAKSFVREIYDRLEREA